MDGSLSVKECHASLSSMSPALVCGDPARTFAAQSVMPPLRCGPSVSVFCIASPIMSLNSIVSGPIGKNDSEKRPCIRIARRGFGFPNAGPNSVFV